MKKIIKMLVLLMFLFVPTLVFADTKIELVRATGGNQPRFGQTIDNNWVAYDSEAYTVNSVSWDSTASHNVGDYFEPGEGYVLTISYTPKDGFYFEDASLMQATINDLTVNDYTVDSIVSGGVGGNDRIVQYSFDDILPYLIHSV